MSHGVAYLAALTLASVFTFSAIAKLRDPLSTRRALDAVRAPGGAVIAATLPIAELIIAVTLVFAPSRGAVAALVLLALFTLFVVYLLGRGVNVSCGCFGANARHPVSVVDVVRNCLLLLLATMATSIARPSGAELQDVIALTTAFAVAVVVLSALTVRQQLGQLFDNQLPGER